MILFHGNACLYFMLQQTDFLFHVKVITMGTHSVTDTLQGQSARSKVIANISDVKGQGRHIAILCDDVTVVWHVTVVDTYGP